MTPADRPALSVPSRDWQLAVALSLGPLFWLALSVSQTWAPARLPGSASALILAVLVYPVLEEIVFRGAVQEFFAARLGGRRSALTRANLATSVLFAAAHVAVRGDPFAASVFFPSLVFGYFRERHATLASPILLHVSYNAGLFLIFGVPSQ